MVQTAPSMMKYIRGKLPSLIVFILGFLILFSSAVTLAQSDRIQVPRWLIANGGGQSAAGDVRMRASVGQAITGRSSAGNTVLHSGFHGPSAGQNAATPDPNPSPSPVDPTPSSTASPSATDSLTSTPTFTPTSTSASPTSGPTDQSSKTPTDAGPIYLPSLRKEVD